MTAVSITDYGATCDGISDDTAAFAAAIAAIAAMPRGGTILVPGPSCVSAPILVNVPYLKIRGDSGPRIRITNTTPNLPTIQLSDYLDEFSLSDIELNRSVTATAGGDGFVTGVSCDHVILDNVYSRANYCGFNPGPVGKGDFVRCQAISNVSHGWLLAGRTSGAQQWGFSVGCLSMQNGGDGLRYTSVAGGQPALSVGTISRFDTYANRGNGISAFGVPGCQIAALRIHDVFIGQDLGSGLYLDTYGGEHQIDGFFELAGNHNICLMGSNRDVEIGPSQIIQAGNCGIYTNAPGTKIIGAVCRNNGTVSGTPAAGIYVDKSATQCGIVGGASGNNPSGPQRYGISCLAPAVQVANMNLKGNSVAPTYVGPSPASLNLQQCPAA